MALSLYSFHMALTENLAPVQSEFDTRSPMEYAIAMVDAYARCIADLMLDSDTPNLTTLDCYRDAYRAWKVRARDLDW